VFVATVPQPFNGKRRRDEPLPDRLNDRLNLMTEVDFDSRMEDDEGEEEEL
jgi:hypothetical protein